MAATATTTANPAAALGQRVRKRSAKVTRESLAAFCVHEAPKKKNNTIKTKRSHECSLGTREREKDSCDWFCDLWFVSSALFAI